MNLDILSWTEAYLRYKDSVQRKILTLNREKDNLLICNLKDGGTHKYLCVDDLSSLKLADINDFRVSCLNSKKNLSWLLDNWQELKELDVVFLFANPKKAAHWSISPKTHSNIVDKSAIKPGLKALFDSIPEV